MHAARQIKSTRRDVLSWAAAVAAVGWSAPANGYTRKPSKAALKYFNGTHEDNGHSYRLTNWKKIKQQWRRQLVTYQSIEPLGSVVIDTSNHFLYVVFENQTALRYGVGVGRDGFRWYGRARIDRKALWPRWVPPPEMRKRQPDFPDPCDGGPTIRWGRAPCISIGRGEISATACMGRLEPWSIGSNVSSGCIRMFSEDVIDLYQRCPIGTRVLVLKHLGAPR